MVEHELGVVDRLCEHVIVMAQGKVISEGTMETVRRNQEVLDAYLVG
jgi:branched-chain amino acid transport system ATP-binding protein